MYCRRSAGAAGYWAGIKAGVTNCTLVSWEQDQEENEQEDSDDDEWTKREPHVNTGTLNFESVEQLNVFRCQKRMEVFQGQKGVWENCKGFCDSFRQLAALLDPSYS